MCKISSDFEDRGRLPPDTIEKAEVHTSVLGAGVLFLLSGINVMHARVIILRRRLDSWMIYKY